jgi:hypothetical protein
VNEVKLSDEPNKLMKQEAWKSIVGFCEKLFFLSVGTLIAPVIVEEKITYPTLAVILGSFGIAVSLSF